MNRKKTSIANHHAGASAQHVAEQDLATNKNGVAIQCMKHRPLAKAPRESGLYDDNIEFMPSCLMAQS